MKLSKIARLLGIVLILSLIMVALPATPALAVYEMSLSPTSGQIGDTITINGYNATAGVNIFFCFSNQDKAINQYIGTDVTVYSNVTSTTPTATTFIKTFTVPTKFSSNNSDVTSGPHFLYATTFTAEATPRQIILNKVSFNVVGGDVSLNPAQGPFDSLVTITGEDFAASQQITIQFGGTAVSIESGDSSTNSSGDFISSVLVPELEAGIHNIVVTVAGFSVTSQFTVEPDLLISPQSGDSETNITISGTGFTRRQQVDIYFNNVWVKSELLDTNGSFYTSIEVPDLGLAQGSYSIEAEDENQNVGTASFNLTVAETPTPTPTPTTTPTPEPGTTNLTINIVSNQIGIGGSGFIPGALAVLSYEGVMIAEALIDSAGLFGVTFTAPSMTGGVHVIAVTDGTNTDEVTYTVESTPPSNPTPNEPRPGDKVDSPATFDWEDATDISEPVTYALQISSDSNFSEGTIILNITALTTSTYTLTEQEQLELAGQETPYYWRLKAIDGAFNETPWSGPAQFYVSPPFSFPTWATVVLLVVGGIILFGLGYWLGRRTAFFY